MQTVAVPAPMRVHGKPDVDRWFDLAMRLPVIGYSLLLLGLDGVTFGQQVAAHPAAFLQPDVGTLVATTARVCQWLFIGAWAVLQAVRLRPIAKSAGLLPRAAALVAAGMPPFFILFERAPPVLAYNVASTLLGLAASIMAVVTVSFLGRSLSIMPEARRLVTDGPYALVRHPLYVCEVLGGAASVLQYRSVAALCLFVFMIALQVARGNWEEQVLARAFPDFAAYRQRTPFFIPRHPARFAAAFFADPIMRRRSIAVVAAIAALDVIALMLVPRLMS